MFKKFGHKDEAIRKKKALDQAIVEAERQVALDTMRLLASQWRLYLLRQQIVHSQMAKYLRNLSHYRGYTVQPVKRVSK
jgi:hypothetical protein